MKSILLELYWGNYSAINKKIPRDSPYAVVLRRVCDLEDEMKEVLTAEQSAIFERYEDAQNCLLDEGCKMYFVEGCRLGALLMREMTSEAENE